MVLEFAKSPARHESFCRQAYSNTTYPASLLAIGSVNLSTTANGLDQLTQAVSALPDADWVISTLVTPLHRVSGPTISSTLR